jgi:hypothetical protein
MSIVSGTIQAFKSEDAAEESANAMRESTAWQRDLGIKAWDRYMNEFAPLENRIVRESRAPVKVEKEPGFARMLATIERGYGDTEGNLRRSMGGRYQEGSGIERNAMRNLRLQKTAAKSGAIADFAKNLEETRFNRMLQAANLGRNLPATSVTAGAGATAANASLAGMYAKAAQEGWGTVGQSTGNLGRLVVNNWDKWFGGGTAAADAAAAEAAASDTYGANELATWFA